MRATIIGIDCATQPGKVGLARAEVLGSAAIAFTPVGDAVADQSADVAAAISGEVPIPEELEELVEATPPVSGAPASKDDCMSGGWESYGFTNQGACISWYNTNG